MQRINSIMLSFNEVVEDPNAEMMEADTPRANISLFEISSFKQVCNSRAF